MEHTFIRFIQQLFQQRRGILSAVAFIAKFGYWLYLLYGAIEWLRPGSVAERLKRRHTLLFCIATVAFGSTISFFLGRLWKRERPFVQHADIEAVIEHDANASFPSNHSMNSMAASLMLLARGNAWGLPFLFWSIIVGASRVVCGLHFVTDVVGGFLMGAASTAVVYRSKAAKQVVERVAWGYHVVTTIVRTWWRGYI